MTAWQDQPPVSRRQVRQSERGDAAESPVRLAQNPTDQPDFGPFARESWNSNSAAPAEPSARADGVVVRGRRAQLKFPTSTAHDEDAPEESPDAAAPEPLSYITQGRSQVPSYDGPSFRSRAVSAVPDSAADASADAQQGDSEGSYRLRDFSPESRRSTFTAVNRPQGSNTVNAESGDLEYRTQAAPTAGPTPEAPSPETPSAEPVARDEAPRSERTMTRRELRALQQRNDPLPFDAQPSHAPSTEPIRTRERNTEQVASNDAVDAAAPPTLVEPPVLLEPLRLSSFPLFVAPADTAAIEIAHVVAEVSKESDATDEVIRAEIVEDEPHTSLPDFDALLFQAPRSSSEPVDAEPIPMPGNIEEKPFGLLLQEPDAPEENPFGLFRDLDAGEAAAPVGRQNDEPVARDEPVAQDEPVAEPVATDEELVAREAFTPPIGHWSTQASIDDDEQLVENSFSRNVGTTGSITTSALVLPATPDAILAPLSSTGEILITGSISLPSSLGTTGALPARYDHSDVDALLAAGDREDSDPDSAPVRAIRAISTHTASGPLISSVKPKNNNRMLTVVAVSAAVVAAGIVALLIAGVVFKVF